MTDEEVAEAMTEQIVKSLEYPQEEPFDIPITLTDLQWNAVTLALRFCILSEQADDSGPLPGPLHDQVNEAHAVIFQAVSDALSNNMVDDAIESIFKEDT